MKRIGRLILVLGLVIGASGCGDAPRTPQKVRGMAVAGIFYPRSEQDLRKAVDQCLDVKAEPVENLRALVCPHAGYEFSGQTAGIGYKQLAGREIRTVILMGSAHHARFKGAMIPEADAFETPLGLVRISPKAAKLAQLKPFVVKPSCEVNRPEFWQRAPKELPPFGEDTPDTWEHSLEVQLPFLQRTLKDFEIVPVVFGEVDPAAVAEKLLEYLDDKTLVVASSDLSHHHPYTEAKWLDTRSVQEICALGPEGVNPWQACGSGPIMTVMEIARKKGWKAKLLDYRNSGDTAGPKGSVVGYAAIAFFEPARGASAGKSARPVRPEEFTQKERDYLLQLARQSATAAANGKEPPKVDAAQVAAGLTEPRGCFVTLTKKGELRGCIGSILPEEPLYKAVVTRARSAAIEDRRFSPVKPDELAQIKIEVSVLSLPKQLYYESPEELLKQLRPGVDGVVLRAGPYQATFLPQVWEQIPEKEKFLEHLCVKAGLIKSAWQHPQAMIMVYQVKAFEEKEAER